MNTDANAAAGALVARPKVSVGVVVEVAPGHHEQYHIDFGPSGGTDFDFVVRPATGYIDGPVVLGLDEIQVLAQAVIDLYRAQVESFVGQAFDGMPDEGGDGDTVAAPPPGALEQARAPRPAQPSDGPWNDNSDDPVDPRLTKWEHLPYTFSLPPE